MLPKELRRSQVDVDLGNASKIGQNLYDDFVLALDKAAPNSHDQVSNVKRDLGKLK